MFDWITTFIETAGLIAVLLMMLGENVFPPIPSELVMPLAGFVAAEGDMTLTGAIVAGSVGSLLGALLWYYVGVWLGAERLERWARRYGRWLAIRPSEVAKADRWFDRHGGKAVFLGRLVPAVRTFISVPAGMSDMRFRRFILYSALGTVLWTGALAVAGYLLQSQYAKVADWVGPVSDVVIGALLLWYLWRVITFDRDERRDAATRG